MIQDLHWTHQPLAEECTNQTQALFQSKVWTPRSNIQEPQLCACGSFHSCLCLHLHHYSPPRPWATLPLYTWTQVYIHTCSIDRFYSMYIQFAQIDGKLPKGRCRVSHILETPSLSNYFKKVEKCENIYSTSCICPHTVFFCKRASSLPCLNQGTTYSLANVDNVSLESLC